MDPQHPPKDGSSWQQDEEENFAEFASRPTHLEVRERLLRMEAILAKLSACVPKNTSGLRRFGIRLGEVEKQIAAMKEQVGIAEERLLTLEGVRRGVGSVMTVMAPVLLAALIGLLAYFAPRLIIFLAEQEENRNRTAPHPTGNHSPPANRWIQK